MVKAGGGRRLTESCSEDGIVEKRAHQRLQGKIGKAVDGFNQRRPQFLHVFAGVGNIVGQFELVRGSYAELFQVQLQAAVVAADLTADLDHVALLELGGGVGEIVPHAGLDLT